MTYDKTQLIAQINDLRDLDFLIGYADVPLEDHSEYNRIYSRAKAKAATITEHLWPNAIEDEYGLVEIENTLLCYLSPLWWKLVDAAVAKL